MSLISLLEKSSDKKFKIKFINNIPLGDIKKTFANVDKAKKYCMEAKNEFKNWN